MSEAKGRTDFSGYWVLSRTEQLEEFLRALGFPWVVRKAAVKFGGAGSAIDIIHHTDPVLKVTSLNAKGSWTRTYNTERAVEQRSAEGAPVRTTAWWEGGVLCTRLEGSPLGVCDSWRCRRGDALVVKTLVKTPRGAEASCYWFFERMESLQRHVAGASRPALLRALAADQRRVARATRLDTADLQRVLLDWDRWASPADEFIRVASPSYAGARRGGAASAARLRGPSAAGSPSPGLSKSPSTTSLSASVVQSPSESRSDAVRSRLGGEGSSAALESLAGGGGNGASEKFVKEISLVSREPGGAAALPPQPPRPTAPPPSDSLTFPALPATDAAAAPPAIVHRRQRSGMENAGGTKRSGHFRSPSAESNSASHITPARTPSPSTRSAVPTSGEALMVYKLHEFLDARGILAVVPVGQPNDTAEPQLLSMSPEQAEETAARLRELETDMLVSRQANANGCGCCGLIISRQADSLPDHLRVWEMALA